jgi:hypothetical protein
MFLKAAAAPFSKRRSRDCDSLVVSGPLTEEAQVAAVSGFLSFVPFQILKRTRQDSREIILRGQRAGEGNRTPVLLAEFATLIGKTGYELRRIEAGQNV